MKLQEFNQSNKTHDQLKYSLCNNKFKKCEFDLKIEFF